jgi:hypothetical protein
MQNHMFELLAPEIPIDIQELTDHTITIIWSAKSESLSNLKDFFMEYRGNPLVHSRSVKQMV